MWTWTTLLGLSIRRAPSRLLRLWCLKGVGGGDFGVLKWAPGEDFLGGEWNFCVLRAGVWDARYVLCRPLCVPTTTTLGDKEGTQSQVFF